MKRLIYIIITTTLFFSCNKNDNKIDEGAKEGGLFELLTANIIYDLDNMNVPYPIEVKYYNIPSSKIKAIEIYQQYFTTDDNDNIISSDIKLLKTADLSTYNTPGYLTINVTFKELAKSTLLNGVAIDTIDNELKSGFLWKLTYIAVLEDGRRLPLYNKETIFENLKLLDDINIAGTYKIIEKKYYRIGVLRDDLDSEWDSTTVITAVNSKTFKLGTKIGPFAGAGYVVFSLLDEGDIDTYNIKYYKAYPGFTADDLLINGQPSAFCPDDAASLTNVGACAAGSNVLQRGDNDTLVMSFGYVTSGSGPREF